MDHACGRFTVLAHRGIQWRDRRSRRGAIILRPSLPLLFTRPVQGYPQGLNLPVAPETYPAGATWGSVPLPLAGSEHCEPITATQITRVARTLPTGRCISQHWIGI